MYLLNVAYFIIIIDVVNWGPNWCPPPRTHTATQTQIWKVIDICEAFTDQIPLALSTTIPDHGG